MKVRWPGVALVVLLVVGTLLVKNRTRHNTPSVARTEILSVILVADPSEANDSDDGCSVMFRADGTTFARVGPVAAWLAVSSVHPKRLVWCLRSGVPSGSGIDALRNASSGLGAVVCRL